MSEMLRKKSPRAPSIALDEALDRALKVYEKERRHAAPTDAVAQAIGYKNANNGAALAVLASLRYYGLLERPKEGFLAATKEVEAYSFAPHEELRHSLLLKWIRTPSIFTELLDKYRGGLPSDATLKFDLIQQGFNPATATSVIAALRRSTEFTQYFHRVAQDEGGAEKEVEPMRPPEAALTTNKENAAVEEHAPHEFSIAVPKAEAARSDAELDRIPVRLSRGRRAWLLIPSPFFSSDRDRLKAQIDLLLADDEDENGS